MKPKDPKNENLIIGLIYTDDLVAERAREELVKKFGEIDYSSVVLPFTHTPYYEKEIGSNLKRVFVSFKRTFASYSLADVKLQTNHIESLFLSPNSNNRMINIDPGLLSEGKLVLATTKDHQHRIYLGKGIFAEVTLRFTNGTFASWEWTYPDYKSEAYIKVFNEIRDLYIKKLKN